MRNATLVGDCVDGKPIVNVVNVPERIIKRQIFWRGKPEISQL